MRWHGESLQVNVAKPCSYICLFPGEIGSLLAAQEGGEMDGGRLEGESFALWCHSHVL